MGIPHESRDLNSRISSASYATFTIAAVFYSTVTASWPSLVTGNIQHPLRKKGALLDGVRSLDCSFSKHFFCKGEHGSLGKHRNRTKIPKKPEQGFLRPCSKYGPGSGGGWATQRGCDRAAWRLAPNLSVVFSAEKITPLPTRYHVLNSQN